MMFTDNVVLTDQNKDSLSARLAEGVRKKMVCVLVGQRLSILSAVLEEVVGMKQVQYIAGR